MMNKPIYGSNSHCLIGEDSFPFIEGLIGSQQDASCFIAISNKIEEHTRFRFGFFFVPDIVQNKQIILSQLIQHTLKRPLLVSLLELLNKTGSLYKEYASTQLNKASTYSYSKMSFANTAWPKENEIACPGRCFRKGEYLGRVYRG